MTEQSHFGMHPSEEQTAALEEHKGIQVFRKAGRESEINKPMRLDDGSYILAQDFIDTPKCRDHVALIAVAFLEMEADDPLYESTKDMMSGAIDFYLNRNLNNPVGNNE